MSYLSLLLFLNIICCFHLHAACESSSQQQLPQDWATPYEGVETPFYAERHRFIETLRTGDVASARVMLETNPYLTKAQYGGKLTSFHILTAIEHFNPKVDPAPMIELFSEIDAKYGCIRIDELLCDNGQANVNHPDFILLCTGKPLAQPTTMKLFMSPLQIASSYPNTRTLAAFLKRQKSKSFSLTIIKNPLLKGDFEMHRHMIKHTPIRRGEDKQWRHSNEDLLIFARIAYAVLTRFPDRGFEMLWQEDFDLSLFESAKRQGYFPLMYNKDIETVLAPYITRYTQRKETERTEATDRARPERAFQLRQSALSPFSSALGHVKSLLGYGATAQAAVSDDGLSPEPLESSSDDVLDV